MRYNKYILRTARQKNNPAPENPRRDSLRRVRRLVEAGGFGPPKQRCNRFTVCPLWPLGNASSCKVSVTGNEPAIRQIKIYQKCGEPHIDNILFCAMHWSWWTDSNPRPADYKSAALPTELHQHIDCRQMPTSKLLDYYITASPVCQYFFEKFLIFLPKRL